jgi:beta-lactam-binding protein with PASTA domain
MADRLPSFLPRIAILVLVALAATAGLTFAAGGQMPSSPTVPTVTATPVPPVVVPDVRNQAFVFAKGALEEAGFAWQVNGSVRGYPSNIVVAQSPAAGTRLVDTGDPRITLTLKRSAYPQTGEPADTSPYDATAPAPADLAGNPIGPAAPAPTPEAATPKAATPAKATAAPATPAATTATPAAPATSATPATPAATPAKKAAAWPQHRPVAFVVPGAAREPLDEMPLPDRAKALSKWLDSHQTKTRAAAGHWLYQNEWIVTGAKLGWWRGGEALKTLIALDQRTQALWGIGAKSAAAAQLALREVEAKAKS